MYKQSKTWKGALLGSVSMLALGVPMAAEGWQLKGIKYLDMWKAAYALEDLDMRDCETTEKVMTYPAYPNAKKL